MEVPLLGRDVNQELTEFWSPTRRPPRAPPSSPKLTAYDLDHAHQKRSIAELRTLAYLDQQLGITLPCADAHQSRASDSEKPSRRFSFQTQWSSDEENSATNGIHQPTQRYDDDGITLVDVSSPPRSSVSEVNTLSGEDMADAGCDSLEPWIECASRYKPTFSKPWTPAVSTERSFAKGIGIHPRPDALPKEVQDHRASCPSAFTHRTSSPLTRCVSTEQSMAIPLMDNDERSQSWAGFTSHRLSSSTQVPQEQSQKSSWDSDSSDEDHHPNKDKAKPGRSRREKLGRRLTDTFRPLFCRS